MPIAQLLKTWDNWEAGIGYPIEDGTPGMYTAENILGLRGELRPAPAATQVAIEADSGQHFQYFFEESVAGSGTPTYDSTSSTANNMGTQWVNLPNHTVANQPNRVMLVWVADAGNYLPTKVEFGVGGQPFTLAIPWANLTADHRLLSLWYLVNPAVGTNHVRVTYLAPLEGREVLVTASSWYKVDQTGPLGEIFVADDYASAGPCEVTVTSAADTETVVAGGACTNTAQTMTEVIAGAGAEIVEKFRDDVRLCHSWDTGAATVLMKWTLGASCGWGIIAVSLIGVTGGNYLYGQRGKKSGSSSIVKVNKVSLAHDGFGTMETGTHDLAGLTVCGQPVRYQGFWYFPMGDNQKARKLSEVVAGATANDTLDATGTALGADHFANLGHQVISTLKYGSHAGGIRVLKKDGSIVTEADWGSAFQVGDKNERAAAARGLAGLCFVLNVEGLYSFNNTGRSGLVFEDFRMWRHVFDNATLQPYMGGLIISHPTGLLYYIPGQPPRNVGLDANKLAATTTPPGPTDLFGGRYHGVATAGEIVYAIYQPDLSSTATMVLVGYPRGQDFLWQGLGTTTLQDIDHMLGCFVSVSGKVNSAIYVTPTLWYGNGNDLDYKVLSTNGSPFRPKGDTHVVETSGDAYLSELMFPVPHKLSHFVVHTEDMVNGDEWQLSGISDAGADVIAGAPVRASERAERTLNKIGVRRFMPHIQWKTANSSARVPPTIKRIELWGWSE